MNFEDAVKIFTLDEGRKDSPYRDSLNYWTIGIGHLIGGSIYELKLSPKIIEEIFKEDLMTAVKDAKEAVGEKFYTDELNDARKLALVSMLFTLGRSKFSKFRETKEAIISGHWGKVAELILASKWARDVDPKQRKDVGRDDRIAYMFKEGKFHPDYKIGE